MLGPNNVIVLRLQPRPECADGARTNHLSEEPKRRYRREIPTQPIEASCEPVTDACVKCQVTEREQSRRYSQDATREHAGANQKQSNTR